jgi:hypothetical protein
MKTKKAIKIDGPVYKDLVNKGWVPDFVHGTLLEPGSTVDDDSGDE